MPASFREDGLLPWAVVVNVCRTVEGELDRPLAVLRPTGNAACFHVGSGFDVPIERGWLRRRFEASVIDPVRSLIIASIAPIRLRPDFRGLCVLPIAQQKAYILARQTSILKALPGDCVPGRRCVRSVGSFHQKAQEG